MALSGMSHRTIFGKGPAQLVDVFQRDPSPNCKLFDRRRLSKSLLIKRPGLSLVDISEVGGESTLEIVSFRFVRACMRAVLESRPKVRAHHLPFPFCLFLLPVFPCVSDVASAQIVQSA